MLRCGRLIVAITACLVAAPAWAQTASRMQRSFVDVWLGPDWDDAQSDSTRAGGATPGSGFGLGFDAGRSGVELSVGVPVWHVKNSKPQRYLYAGQSFGWQQQGHFYEWSSTSRRRSIDVTALFRFNEAVNRRVTVSWLVGGGYVYRPDRFNRVTHEVLAGGQLVEAETYQSRSSRNYPAAIGRVELEVEVTPRLSVVPRLKVTVFPSLLDDSGQAPRILMARPEVAVRWRF